MGKKKRVRVRTDYDGVPSTTPVLVSIYVPAILKELLARRAEEEDTTMSWLVCDLLFEEFGVDRHVLYDGEVLPKTKTERRELYRQLKADSKIPVGSGRTLFQIKSVLMGVASTDSWLTVKQIAEATRFSEQTVRKCMKALVDEGTALCQRKGLGGRVYYYPKPPVLLGCEIEEFVRKEPTHDSQRVDCLVIDL